MMQLLHERGVCVKRPTQRLSRSLAESHQSLHLNAPPILRASSITAARPAIRQTRHSIPTLCEIPHTRGADLGWLELGLAQARGHLRRRRPLPLFSPSTTKISVCQASSPVRRLCFAVSLPPHLDIPFAFASPRPHSCHARIPATPTFLRHHLLPQILAYAFGDWRHIRSRRNHVCRTRIGTAALSSLGFAQYLHFSASRTLGPSANSSVLECAMAARR
ncbi:hypothetical protein K402DRAFT_261995 [Aulographum hederae CBS 113979]|uniref:Uncharacterized protein n=1 Tax=Aulographum hederae CBS 113979 TaxID=1176131 RepID=A0A6G1H905_9PEZI|nr:hypothetical protein K402DRAFT_261995 [Aulographum hederae CBS 113979]